MKGIRYVSPLYDVSGYGEASRNHIMSLYEKIPMTLKRMQFDPTDSSIVGKMSHILGPLENREIDYGINIIHLIPEFFSAQKKIGKINIGFMYWETSLLPDKWVNDINDNVDAMFTVCDYTKKSMLDSGVKVPIFKVLPAFNSEEFNTNREPLKILNNHESIFKFYSIFQWAERKHPEGLLKAYLSEFTIDDNVILILKAYVNADFKQSTELMRNKIKDIKAGLKLIKYPPILLISNFLSRDDMLALHKLGDCFILAHRSEGLGMPHLEAMMMGKPTVATNLGGNTEFMHLDNSYLISYHLTPVCNEPYLPWYTGKMEWAEPNLSDLRTHMRYIYENQAEAKRKAEVGQEYVHNKYSYEKSAESFLDAIKGVERKVKKNGLKNAI